jgi:hypothetical protein
LVVTVACGPSPTPVTPKPVVVDKPNAPAVRARWVFSGPEREIRAKLDLGDHKTLYVGGHGRRELEDNGETKHAQTLAEEALGGVMRDDKGRFVFVATDGDTYRATEPLGPIERVAPARTEPLASVTTGKAAIVGISPKGLVRSTDFGATWTAVAYDKSKSYGHAASVALDGSGNGVLVHLPQRVFVTHDDGATWTALASPPHGAASVLRDGANRIFTFGYYDRAATLAKDTLTETSDEPASIFPGQKLHEAREMPEDPSERRPRLGMPRPFRGGDDLGLELEDKKPIELLAGDHVVEIAAHGGKIETRAAAIGEPLGNGTAQPALDSGALDRARVAAWNGDVAFVRAPRDDDDDSETPTTTIVRSKNFGATWKNEETFPGVPAHDAHAIALGPRGWTYVGAICKQRSNDCTPARIRPAGKQAFEPATSDPAFDPWKFAFDEVHGKVYALFGDGVYEGALDGAKLAKLANMTFDEHPSALTVDTHGALRAFEEHRGGVVTIRSRSATGEVQPPRYVQLGDGRLAFAGSHGLLIGNHASWETNDAGDTWTRVASNGETSRLACAEAGCILDGARRIGWDLPALGSTEVVRASANAPAEQTTETKPAMPKPTPLDLACKVSGKGKTITAPADMSWIDGTLPARWAQVSNAFMDTNKVTLTWADKDSVHENQLLEPKRSTMELRTATDERDEGIVAARYQYVRRNESGKLNPVQIELAWWSPSKPTQVHHAHVTVKPFRVSRFAFSGRARVVDGGIVFQGGRDDVVHFVHDDGKEESFAAPGIPFSDVVRAGNKWVFADSDGTVVETASSEDGGKTWALRGWAFDTMPSNQSGLMTMNGKPVVIAHGALYDVAWPVAADPPAPVVIDLASHEPRCDALVTASTSERERIDDDSIHVDLGGVKLAGTERVRHVTQTGKLCTAVLRVEQGRDVEAYVYPDAGGGWSGWSYREKDDKTLVEPLTCK